MKQTDKAVHFFTQLIKNSTATDGSKPLDMTPADISKIMFERLTDAEVGNLKLFFYSTARSTNNKPYKFNKKVSIKHLKQILELQDQLRSLKSNEAEDVMDLFDEPIGEPLADLPVNPEVTPGKPRGNLSDEDRAALLKAGLMK